MYCFIISFSFFTLIFIDAKYFRPAEVEQLLGNHLNAITILGCVAKTTFKNLVKEMVDYDCKKYNIILIIIYNIFNLIL